MHICKCSGVPYPHMANLSPGCHEIEGALYCSGCHWSGEEIECASGHEPHGERYIICPQCGNTELQDSTEVCWSAPSAEFFETWAEEMKQDIEEVFHAAVDHFIYVYEQDLKEESEAQDGDTD